MYELELVVTPVVSLSTDEVVYMKRLLSKLPRCFKATERWRLYCTLHTAHCTLHTAHCTLHTAHYTVTYYVVHWTAMSEQGDPTQSVKFNFCLVQLVELVEPPPGVTLKYRALLCCSQSSLGLVTMLDENGCHPSDLVMAKYNVLNHQCNFIRLVPPFTVQIKNLFLIRPP